MCLDKFFSTTRIFYFLFFFSLCFHFTRCAAGKSSANVDSHVFHFIPFHFSVCWLYYCTMFIAYTGGVLYSLRRFSVCCYFHSLSLDIVEFSHSFCLSYSFDRFSFFYLTFHFMFFRIFLCHSRGRCKTLTTQIPSHTHNERHKQYTFFYKKKSNNNIHFDHHTHTHTHIRMRLNNQTRKINKRKD